MVDVSEALQAAREAYGRRDWPRARELFTAARADVELSAEDLYALSDAAWWMGAADESITTCEQAYRAYLDQQRPRQAAMAAFDVAINLFLRGDEARGSGWMGRAQRLLADEPDGAEHGYVRYVLEVEAALDGIAAPHDVGLDALTASARAVQDIGRRHGDPSLVAVGMVGEGRALVRQGRVPEGVGLLDEAMLAVLGGDLNPAWAGNAYCHLMSAAWELTDFRRAAEWTEATARWLEGMPVAVVFTGVCRVHRSQVHQLHGAWERAEADAARVCTDLVDIEPAAAAEGHYQVGDIRRLRGDLAGAEESYQQAHRLGRDPQPGVALLRLAQGRLDAASASIRAALVAESADRLARARLCAAQVEIALAADDLVVARKACEELEDIAVTYGTTGLQVMARHARGSVLLAEGHPEEALPVLRDACRRWQDVEAPYDCARVRVLLALAYDALGDADAAGRELDAAAEVFDRLGAEPDSRQVAALRPGRPHLPDGLTAREAEVLALVAGGKTNRDIADELVISQKTVARHLSNIFTKLDVSSRTAAAGYAYEHGLASPAAGRG